MSTLLPKSIAKSADETASELSASDLWCSDFVVQNNDTTNEVFIGGSDVDDVIGFKLAAGAAVGLSALVGQRQRKLNLKDVYVVCSAGETADLRVLYLTEEFE